MTLPDWVIPSLLIAIIGFFLRRYLKNQDKRNDLQDKKYDTLAKDLRVQGEKFLKGVQDLTEVIAGLRVHSASQKTLANERHRQTTEHLERVDRDIGNLWDKHNENVEKINHINQRLSKHELSQYEHSIPQTQRKQ
jgi:hypothetical protein